MKILIYLFVLAGTMFAAAPVVTVDDNFNTFVDGVNFGKAGDVIVNNKANAALVVEVNLAITARMNAIKAAATASVTAAQAATATAETAKAAAVTRADALVASLKGVSPTLLPANVKAELLTAQEKERAALLAQKAALDAQVAALKP